MFYLYFQNSSILCIWLSTVAAFILPFTGGKKRYLKPIATISIFALVTTIICLGGRAALLGFISATTFIFWRATVLVYLKKKFSVFPVLIMGILLFLYYCKYDSSIGRIHIYSISFQIFKDNWLTGIGIGKFKAVFNEYQAAYFIHHDINSKRALLADNTFYAFDDYLQWVVEAGVLGLILLAVFISWLLKRISRLLKRNDNNAIVKGVIAGVISLSVSALFSYPFQILPIQFTAIIFIGIILFFPDRPVSKNRKDRILADVMRIIFIPFSVFFFYQGIFQLRSMNWENRAFHLYMTGKKAYALKLYRELAISHYAYGYYKYLYAEQCYYMNQLERADSVLNEAQKTYVANQVYSLKARIFSEKGNLKEAEKSYLKAIYMVPNRMTSRYEIVNFYLENKDTINALRWANSIREMPVKVSSEKTDKILFRINEIIKELEEKNRSDSINIFI
jgi:tetratricopeptide (TPR) repeat protein